LKLTADRPFADPEAAARRILEIAQQVEPVMKGRIYIELINGPFLFRDRASPAEYGAGLKLLIERKELMMHDGGTFVWLPGAEPRCSAIKSRRSPLNICCPPNPLDRLAKLHR
jgi:hypothetical protein